MKDKGDEQSGSEEVIWGLTEGTEVREREDQKGRVTVIELEELRKGIVYKKIHSYELVHNVERIR